MQEARRGCSLCLQLGTQAQARGLPDDGPEHQRDGAASGFEPPQADRTSLDVRMLEVRSTRGPARFVGGLTNFCRRVNVKKEGQWRGPCEYPSVKIKLQVMGRF